MVRAPGNAPAPHATGELVNSAELDWPNIDEEIEGVGRSERRACESQLVLALVHDLKAEAWPLSQDVAHWRAEARHQSERGACRVHAVDAVED
jgi:hypothetical protein